MLLSKLDDDLKVVSTQALSAHDVKRYLQSDAVEAIIAEQGAENEQVLELAYTHKLAFALYEPDVNALSDLLLDVLDGAFRQTGKIMFFEDNHSAQHPLVIAFANQGRVMFGGDYQKACHELVEQSIHWGETAD